MECVAELYAERIAVTDSHFPKIQHYIDETEIAVSLQHQYGSKTELSWMKKETMLILAQYEDSSTDIPSSRVLFARLPEVQALKNLLNMPEMQPFLP